MSVDFSGLERAGETPPPYLVPPDQLERLAREIDRLRAELEATRELCRDYVTWVRASEKKRHAAETRVAELTEALQGFVTYFETPPRKRRNPSVAAELIAARHALSAVPTEEKE